MNPCYVQYSYVRTFLLLYSETSSEIPITNTITETEIIDPRLTETMVIFEMEIT